MRLFGYELRKVTAQPRGLSSVDEGRGSWMTIFGGSSDPAAWFQRDEHHTRHDAHRNWTVFSCQTLIAGDVSKLSIDLVELVEGVWQPTTSPTYRQFLRKPNGFQTWQQFAEQWVLSKLSCGNAYILKDRDQATRVNAAYVLDPGRVTPLVAPDGGVYYRLKADALAGVPDDGDVVIPASEIMHDRMNCLFHPLVGLSPLYASALAASQGLTILEKSRNFFNNGSRPGGMLVTPQELKDDAAKRYKSQWDQTFGGDRAGGTAVLGNGLDYKPIAMSAVDSELVKQLNMTAEMICSTFHVPAYKVGVGATPTYQNAEILNQIYYDSCLQKLIESIEALLDDGLELQNVNGRTLRAQFDLDGLLRMDGRTKISAIAEAVGAGVMAPNEGRRRISLPPVPGGDSPFLQQQNWSHEALAKRDSDGNPSAVKAIHRPGAAAGSTDAYSVYSEAKRSWDYYSERAFWKQYGDRPVLIEVADHGDDGGENGEELEATCEIHDEAKWYRLAAEPSTSYTEEGFWEKVGTRRVIVKMAPPHPDE